MGIGEIATSTAVDLVKSENIQNKTVSLLGMLFPYAGIEKRALDMYLSDVEKSDMSPESKLIATLNAKTTIATVYKGNIIKNLIMGCQSYTKYRPNETTGGIFVSWRRKEELPTGA